MVSWASPLIGITRDTLDRVYNAVAGDKYSSGGTLPRCVVIITIPSRWTGLVLVPVSFVDKYQKAGLTDE